MQIKEYEQAGWTVFTLHGRIDNDGAALVEKTLFAIAERGKHRMVVDLSDVQYMNSRGLRCLMTLLRQCQEGGGNLILVKPTSHVKEVFQMIGFDKFFRIYDTIAHATQS